MKHVKPVFNRRNLLWILPISFLITLFENQVTAFFFAVCLSFITSRMFPWVEYKIQDKKEEQQ